MNVNCKNLIVRIFQKQRLGEVKKTTKTTKTKTLAQSLTASEWQCWIKSPLLRSGPLLFTKKP